MSLKAFNEQRHNANRRGIPFLLTYDQWLNWWVTALGPDWKKLRGRTKRKYCMARNNDAGAYEIDNIKCIRHSENITDAAVNNTIAYGIKAGHAVLTENAVVDIYTSNNTMQQLAEHYGISLGTVNDIRAGRTWRRATSATQRTSLRGRNHWT